MPLIPKYAKAAPLPNKNCIGCSAGNGFVYPPFVAGPGGGGKVVEVTEGFSIDVDNESDTDTYRFKVSYDPTTVLTASISIVLKALGVTKSQPVLLGIEIDEIIPTWSYNKAVTSQSLTAIVTNPDPTITFPSITAALRTIDQEDVSITNNASVTIHGVDGIGFTTANAITQIRFGNYVAWGDSSDKIGQVTTVLATLFSALSKTIQTSKAKALTTTGDANEYFFYAVPKRFGEVTFTKGIFPGGYRRLKSVLGVLKVVLDPGDDEEDVLIDNGTGYTEAYYFYQSEYDNKNDTVTPTYAS